MKLQAHQILVLHVATDAVPTSLYEQLFATLSIGEQQRALAYRFEKDRLAFATSRTLVRQTLAQNGVVNPTFLIGEHGKPHLIRHPGQPDIHFNISHCTGMVVAAFALGHELGVDVEFLDRRARDMDVARSNFAPSEVSLLEAATGAQQREMFFAFWTLKEAYVKARGLGLTVALKEFAFTLHPPQISFTEHMQDSPAQWFFAQTKPGASHLMALAAHRQPNDQLTVIQQEIHLQSLLPNKSS